MSNRRQQLLARLSASLGTALIIFMVWMLAFPLTNTSAQDEATPEQEEAEASPEAMTFTPSGDNSYCLVCHNFDTSQDLAVEWENVTERTATSDLAALIHSSHADTPEAGCLDCHPNDSFPHLEAREVGSIEDIAGNYTESCIGCHQHSELEIEGGCDTCHGEYEIPRDAAVLDVGLEECEVCHSSTVAEWRVSGHGDQQLACDSCHFPHQGELRFADVNLLCLNCHEQPRTGFAHVMHVEQACSDCHIFHEDSSSNVHVLTGGNVMGYTGHDNQVSTQSCIDCHAEGVEVAAVIDEDGITIDSHPIIQAQERIETLETEIEDVREETSQEAAIRFAQSLVIGLALGGFGGLLIDRFRIRQTNIVEGEEEHDE